MDDRNYAMTTVQDQPNWMMILNAPEKLTQMATIMIQSGLFDPTSKEEKEGYTQEKGIAMACVKIQAGLEFGLKPFAAMRGLHSIKGKITPSYQVMLAMVRRAGYDYKIVRQDNEGAEIEWLGQKEGGKRESLGRSTFNKDDQARAQLWGDNWKKFPKNMMISKCVSSGVNTYLADVFDGPVYTPEDFNSTVEEIEAPAREVEAPAKKPTAASASKATASPSTVSSAKVVEPSVNQDAPITASSSTPKEKATTPVAQATKTEPPKPKVEEGTTAIMAVGEVNGWNEEDLQNWMIPYLQEKGCDVSSFEALEATWNQEILDGAIEFVSTNGPPAIDVETV